MIKFFIVIIALFLCPSSNAQTDISPQGIYMNINEIINEAPFKKVTLEVKRRSISDIKMSGGNDYKLISLDNSISKKAIRKQILAYSTGDTLFINCLRYKVQPWYASVISAGRYLAFIGGISQEENLFNYQTQKDKSYNFWKNIGGGISGGISGAKLALKRFLYVIDTKSDELSMIDEDTIRRLLAEKDLGLLKQYDADIKENKQEEIEALLLKYVNILNDKD